jgi:molecular chaperone DnaK (HSP70)
MGAVNAPATLRARSSDGTCQELISEGAPLPASARIVFATTRAGQDAIEIELLEGGDKRIAGARFTLPRGLPPNCWIPIEVSIGLDLVVRAEARENLRRIRIDAEFDAEGGVASYYSV